MLANYAKLAINTGVNVQKGQTLLIDVKPEHYAFARLCVDQAYQRGAKRVIVRFMDDIIHKSHIVHQDEAVLCAIPTWRIDEMNDYLDDDVCFLKIYAPSPGLLSDVDGDKIAHMMKAQGEAFKRQREYTMANRGQWCIISLPTKEWASTVFPDADVPKASEQLLDLILKTVRIDAGNDAQAAWKKHNATLALQNQKLNDFNFKTLHFTNGQGTDLRVGLVENHIWAGGEDVTEKGIPFNPNMPTEESFTMPDAQRVDGIVYSSMPLNYNGKLIDEFWLRFENGKVIDFDAKQEKEALASLLSVDEGSSRIGEIALISYESPISKAGILFYNTLFDENASCHIALGRAYPINIKGGTAMSEHELIQHHSNQSIVHEDFMFGTSDMKVVGLTHDDTEIVVFDQGNFVI